MKKLISLSGILIITISCSLFQKNPKISFENDNITFVSKKDSSTKLKYNFVNTGSSTLSILNVTTDCGCTDVNYPKAPIAPSDSGTIIVTFDSKGFPAATINKAIIVEANTEPMLHSLTFTAVIK